MKQAFLLKIVFLSLCFCIIHTALFSQNGEVNLLKRINPNPPTSGFWKAVSHTSEPISVAIPVTMFVTQLINKNYDLKWKSAEAVASLGSIVITTELLKLIVKRPRPYEKYSDIYPDKYERGKSFPSGHTTLAFSAATTLSLQYKKWYVVVPAYVWASAVSYSRLYLGQHYPSDILCSVILGAGSAWIEHKVARRILKKSGIL